MSGFVNNLITRHTEASNKITPRLPGIFEPARLHIQELSGNDFANTKVEPASDPMTMLAPGQIEKASETMQQKNEHNILAKSDATKNFERQERGETNNQPEKKIRYPDKAMDETLKTPIDSSLPDNDSKASNTTVEISGDNLHKAVTRIAKQSISNEEKNSRPGTLMNYEPGINQKINAPVIDPRPIATMGQYVPSYLRPDSSFHEGGSNSTSVIKISIGRIEVKAVSAPAVKPNNDAKVQKPKMSLEDYLAKRNDNKS
ncbi:MAG TPA: hypothetical protein VGQ59_20850 [Cyclobacteriaceae bacterium]|jgi:hypothetical protein|nr:hypothetical protein [Cyclobacteriaceae bacterium]